MSFCIRGTVNPARCGWGQGHVRPLPQEAGSPLPQTAPNRIRSASFAGAHDVVILWAPTFCSVVGSWLVYLLLYRKRLASEPRRPGGLEVILCGFPKTGTQSLTAALQILGFPCLHGVHLFHPTIAKRFLKAYKHGNPQDWERLLEGFTAIADHMAASCYRQLATVYPNAKIILNVRDANKWYDSFSNTILRGRREAHFVFKLITPNVNKESFYKQFFNGIPENRDIYVTAFLQHIQDVRKHVPPEKLLIYDVEKEEGWPSLCQFLNVPMPEVPFPKANARNDFNAAVKRIVNVYKTVLAVYVIVVACAFLYII